MCGINGIIYKKNQPDINEILNMNFAVNHRGPDDQGTYKFENLILGHTRLSILDLTSKGKQPMSNDGNYWIVYNGEIYNFKSIKEQLISLGYKFHTKTDTEVILNAYKEWGINSFNKFNGMWSFCILDQKEKKIILCRDRYGVKPCYIYNDNNKIIFSSEIKGIFASNSDIVIDCDKLLLSDKNKEKYFTTNYKNLDILQPGFLYEINIGNTKIKKTRWWNGLKNIPEISINKKNIKEKLKYLLIKSTKARLVSDVKIATSLSGGIDSSIIFSILNGFHHEISHLDLNPIIVDYKNNKTLDAAIEISNFHKRKPVIIKYDQDNMDDLSYKLSTIELSSHFFSQLEIYKEQKNLGYKVSIDGHGADESLGGYINDIEQFSMYFQNSQADLYQAILNLQNETRLSETIKRYGLSPNLKRYNIDISNAIIPKYNNNQYIGHSPDPKALEVPKSLIDDIQELKFYNFPFQVLYLNSCYGHMQWLLNKWDKASMASSVEVRSPFLDWEFFQYALALPAELKIKNGLNKSILRETFGDMIPELVKNNKFKQGLPRVNFSNKEAKLNLIKEVVSQKNFIDTDIWNGKRILKEAESDLDNNKFSDIWKIVNIYLLYEGLMKRKVVINTKNEFQPGYNRLS